MPQRVCIIGVGLIGGSIGLALRRPQAQGDSYIVGVGRDRAKLDRAIELGAIDEASLSISDGATGADLVVACTPVQQIVDHLDQAAATASVGALLTDAGSTKGTLVEAASSKPWASRYVAAHPLAGSDRSGVEHARGDLFEGRTVILTPHGHNPTETLDRAEAFWRSIGAVTTRLPPDDHDAALAVTSHLPHLVASMVAASTPPTWLPMTAGGWADVTRIAAGQPALWREIILENRGHILQALHNFDTIRQRWQKALEADDADAIESLLIAGKAIRDALGNRHPPDRPAG